MRVLIFSDSHGQKETMLKAFHAENEPGAVYHLGDGAAEFKALSADFGKAILLGHKGNCDSGDCGFPTESLRELCGVKLFACHGHTQHVKSGLIELMFSAMERNAKICLYGHTHIPDVTYHNGIWFVNPGAAMIGRYAVIELGEDGSIYPKLQSL